MSKATTDAGPLPVLSSEGLGPTPLPTPAGFRTRYRSEPGMIGHYPWTYADQGRRRIERPDCEYEDLFTADQVRALLAAERERAALVCDDEARLRSEAGAKHHEDSPSRGRCFAAARAAINCARGVRSGEVVGPNASLSGCTQSARSDS